MGVPPGANGPLLGTRSAAPARATPAPRPRCLGSVRALAKATPVRAPRTRRRWSLVLPGGACARPGGPGATRNLPTKRVGGQAAPGRRVLGLDRQGSIFRCGIRIPSGPCPLCPSWPGQRPVLLGVVPGASFGASDAARGREEAPRRTPRRARAAPGTGADPAILRGTTEFRATRPKKAIRNLLEGVLREGGRWARTGSGTGKTLRGPSRFGPDGVPRWNSVPRPRYSEREGDGRASAGSERVTSSHDGAARNLERPLAGGRRSALERQGRPDRETIVKKLFLNRRFFY